MAIECSGVKISSWEVVDCSEFNQERTPLHGGSPFKYSSSVGGAPLLMRLFVKRKCCCLGPNSVNTIVNDPSGSGFNVMKLELCSQRPARYGRLTAY